MSPEESENARLLAGSEVVCTRLELANRPLSRMRGLLGRSSLEPGSGLWITPCSSIHMMFMRFPIDAVFVDRDLTVMRVVEELAPWRTARGGRGAHSVFELPAGTARRTGITPGTSLSVSTT